MLKNHWVIVMPYWSSCWWMYSYTASLPCDFGVVIATGVNYSSNWWRWYLWLLGFCCPAASTVMSGGGEFDMLWVLGSLKFLILQPKNLLFTSSSNWNMWNPCFQWPLLTCCYDSSFNIVKVEPLPLTAFADPLLWLFFYSIDYSYRQIIILVMNIWKIYKICQDSNTGSAMFCS